MSNYDYPLIVVGAGAGGLVVAIGAAKAGKRVLLIEKGNYGGDCTNFGCIPSKTLIAAAHSSHEIAHGHELGLEYEVPRIQSAGVLNRVRDVVAHFRSHENPETLQKLGVETLTGHASFLNAHTLQVKEPHGQKRAISGKNIVLSTGSRPVVPPIPGLDSIDFLTNESVFSLEDIPLQLLIIGGGAIGCELAQAFARLGSRVQLVEFFDRLLARGEPEASEIIQKTLARDGVEFFLSHKAEEVQKKGDLIQVKVRSKEYVEARHLNCTHVLLVVGRQPNLEGLQLEAAGIQYERAGIQVDSYGRTTAKHVWAVGDCSGGALFTHIAEAEARKVLTSLLLPGLFKVRIGRHKPVPSILFTDPEVATIGLTEEEAIQQWGASKLAVYHLPFSQVDRAVCTGRTEGLVKIVTKKWSSRILGATLIGPRAGEMLGEISTAMEFGVPLRKLSGVIHPYPGYNRAIRKAADLWLTQTILPTLRRIFGK